jgi:ribulose-phosphate 3-epimerase
MSRSETMARLLDAAPAVLPSLLLCDFADLRGEVARLEAAGVAALHLDVMDGHFVPNLTYGLPLVETFRRLTSRPLDVHLMIDNPDDFIEHYAEAGADVLTIHVEAVPRPRDTLRRIRELDKAAGLAINPRTPLEAIEDCFDCCDVLLVMSVQPGFGGQKFEPLAVERLHEVRRRLGPAQVLEVDGGINGTTIGECARAGAQLFVVGSAIFRTADYAQSVRRLEAEVNK